MRHEIAINRLHNDGTVTNDVVPPLRGTPEDIARRLAAFIREHPTWALDLTVIPVGAE